MPFLLATVLLTAALFAQEPPRSDEPPRHGRYSSSKDEAPPADEPDLDTSGTTEMRPYDPHKAEKDVEVGDFYRKRGNLKAAINRYRGALDWKPNDPAATIRLAMALEQVRDLAEAHRYYVLYLETNPEGANAGAAREGLARLQSKLQLDENAVRALTALEIGEYHLEQKNFPAAVVRLKEAEQLTPDAARVVFRLGQALEATGELAGAHTRYRRYLEMQPGGSFARAAERGLKRLQGFAEQQGKSASAPSVETPR